MPKRATEIRKAAEIGTVCAATVMSALGFGSPALAANTCTGHYVPPGVRGHGEITFAEGATIGWTISDYIDDPVTGCAKVVCRHGVAPESGANDLDFFEYNGEMYKLIGGTVTLRKDGFDVDPKRAVRFRIFSSPSAFSVLRTSQLYRFNHWRADKMSGRDTLQPLAYLQRLKAQNETCAGLPVPDLRPPKQSPTE